MISPRPRMTQDGEIAEGWVRGEAIPIRSKTIHSIVRWPASLQTSQMLNNKNGQTRTMEQENGDSWFWDCVPRVPEEKRT